MSKCGGNDVKENKGSDPSTIVNQSANNEPISPQLLILDHQSILDDTIVDSPPNGALVVKSQPVKDDVATGKFPTDIIEITRGKGGQLGIESITHGVYKNKCGFRTSDPIKWAEAFESLFTDSRWDYTLNKSLYTKCAIKVPSAGGAVTVEIAFTTGVICVWGTHYQKWVDHIFEAWKKLAVDGIVTHITPLEASGKVTTLGNSTIREEAEVTLEIEWL